ncbi:MAG: hypothetical protein DRP82_05835 [Planctomycetota bacterium]|nr:MAG: hypothetical protein DRP82_05835 [Planctomycetota bacterium]
MSVRLKHHIYTSVGGYGTVYADAAIEKLQLERLERLAGMLYPRASGRAFLAFFHFDSKNALYLKVFRSGVDHVGRPKACVHIILAEVNGAVPPAPEEGWFLDSAPTQSDIPSLRNRLPKSAERFDIIQTAHLIAQAELTSDPLLSTLILAAISNRPFYIRGDFFLLMRNLAKVMALIPRPSRLRIRVVCPASISQLLVPPNIVMSTFYCVNSETTPPENAAVLSLSPFSAENLPETNAYIDFLKEASPDEVSKLVAILERYAPYEPLTCDAYERLVLAFRNCQDTFTLDGEVDLSKVRPPFLVSLRDFLAAGFEKLVTHVLELLIQKVSSESELVSLLTSTKKILCDPTTAQYDRENALDKTIRRLIITLGRRGGSL